MPVKLVPLQVRASSNHARYLAQSVRLDATLSSARLGVAREARARLRSPWD
jgi:hypothetical protein